MNWRCWYEIAVKEIAISVGCDAAYRLNPSGNINIPTETIAVDRVLPKHCVEFLILQQSHCTANKTCTKCCSYSRQRAQDNGLWRIGTSIWGSILEGEISSAGKLSHLIRFYLFVPVAAAFYLTWEDVQALRN
ncbi:hypothetical protein VNO77_18278 [Canavalia gladiata]|uniref:Uncharacterized protein n=1 Tax=Canavalia gladiata TaxID=3824 RepID=A0AAN9LP46_CANGL